LLSSQGIQVSTLAKLPEQLDTLRLWDGTPIPPGLRRRVLRVYAHHTFLNEQIAAIEAERRAQLQTSRDASIDHIRQLMMLKLGFAVHRYMNVILSFISSTYEKPLKGTSQNTCIYVDGIKARQ
jgi:hypothetical protein